MLGQLLLRGDKKRKLIDEGFNRHANHDTNLPEWFADDERKYRGPAGYAMDLPEDLMEQARHRLTLTLVVALTPNPDLSGIGGRPAGKRPWGPGKGQD